MSLLLQQGWGMMSLSAELLESGVGSGVILSPRVLRPEQATRHAVEVRERGAAVLFDPQFYVPRTQLERILEFPYWQGLQFDTEAFDEDSAAEFCKRVIDYERGVLNVTDVILPGTYTNTADERWRIWQARFAEAGAEYCPDARLYSTVAIGPDVVRSRYQFDAVLDEVIGYPVAGIYLLLRPPNDSFLVADEDYLYAALDGLLSIRGAGKDVIIGYANQQSLIFAAVGVTTIASGNFRNVRSYNPEIFDVQGEDERQRALWYYDAGMLSEFRIQTIQLAYRRGLRGLFGPECRYCAPLLGAQDPGAVNWIERDGFRHFLCELDRQWRDAVSVPANARLARVRGALEDARARLRGLSEQGVVLGDRTFAAHFEPCVAALEAIRADRAVSIGRL